MMEESLKNQILAADHESSSWVLASAGSGKTKILTDRVLNLLLSGTPPERILCLTFTKASAKEMADRINRMLGIWTMAEDLELESKLSQLHGKFAETVRDKSRKAEAYAALMKKARTLFSKVMDVPGGMKIMTIHSFCQSVLRRFPVEAKISPYFEVMEEREARGIIDRIRHNIMEEHENMPILEKISRYINEDDFSSIISYLDRFRRELGSLDDDISGKLEKVLKIPRKGRQELLEEFFKSRDKSLRKVIDKLSASSKQGDRKAHDVLKDIVDGQVRFEEYFSLFFTDKNKPRVSQVTAFDDEMPGEIENVYSFNQILLGVDIQESTENLLLLGLKVLQGYNTHKRREALMDYDDLIIRTYELFSDRELSPWVLYKLDGGIDHILVDEAQDTSPAQWGVIRAIAEEFFSGNSSRSDVGRTLFVVGDRKQSIYSFQGADINTFEEMRFFFADKVTASHNRFREVPINISFRSSSEILDFVDTVLGYDKARSGVLLDGERISHTPFFKDKPGRVEIWPLEEYADGDEEDEREDWSVPEIRERKRSPKEVLAEKISSRIALMIGKKKLLVRVDGKDTTRFVEPRDIMILVRRRDAFALDIIRKLKQKGIDVGGIDRLRLLDHIAVQDLVSLGKFLLYPDDDLSLAEVLKSPLVDISEKDLYELGFGRNKESLWQRIKQRKHHSFSFLDAVLTKVDYLSPFELYSYVFGPLKGREKYLSRMGEEAIDAMGEFVSLAGSYADRNSPSLQGFINFIQHDDMEVKREQDQNNVVRLMTVHGSKGLQAPIVFLPDTTSMATETIRVVWVDGIPLWIPRAAMAPDFLKRAVERHKEVSREEYRRLLYVAMTRAANELYICGYGHKKAPPEGNWYQLITEAISNSHSHRFRNEGDGILVLDYGKNDIGAALDLRKGEDLLITKEDWMEGSAPKEKDALKPVVPSRMKEEEDIVSASPLDQKEGNRFAKGIVIHKILQYLPRVHPEERDTYIERAVNNYGAELSDKQKQSVTNKVKALLQDNRMRSIFSNEVRTEVNICGVVGDFVVSGQVDVLIVKEDEVIVVDYKSNVNPPSDFDEVPEAYVKQMRSYRDVLSRIYEGRRIRTFLLWVETLSVIEIN